MGSLLNKVYFPPETPALANVVPVVIQAFIEAFILVVVLAIVQNLFWTVLLFPLLLLVLGLFASRASAWRSASTTCSTATWATS